MAVVRYRARRDGAANHRFLGCPVLRKDDVTDRNHTDFQSQMEEQTFDIKQ